MQIPNIFVILAMTNALEQDGFKVGVTDIIKHPKYTTYDNFDDYDILILVLEQKVASFLGNKINPICLPIMSLW